MPTPTPKRPRHSRRTIPTSKLLAALEPLEARTVLARLLATHPELEPEAEQIARKMLGVRTAPEVAKGVEVALLAQDLAALSMATGRFPGGYVDPSQGAQNLLEDALRPDTDDMRRKLELGLEDDALVVCRGMLRGLHAVRAVNTDGALGWSPDFPLEKASTVLQIWAQGVRNRRRRRQQVARGRPTFTIEMLEEDAPEWASDLERFLRQT